MSSLETEEIKLESATENNDVVNVEPVQEPVEEPVEEPVQENKMNDLFYYTLVDLLKLETYHTNNNMNLLFSNKTKEVVTKNVQQLLYITIIDVLKASIQNSNASIAIDDKTKEIINDYKLKNYNDIL